MGGQGEAAAAMQQPDDALDEAWLTLFLAKQGMGMAWERGSDSTTARASQPACFRMAHARVRVRLVLYTCPDPTSVRGLYRIQRPIRITTLYPRPF